MRRISGLPGAPGVAVGPIWAYRPFTAAPTAGRPRDPESAAEAIQIAAVAAGRELEAVAASLRAAGKADDAAILEAQSLMASDPELLDRAVALARSGEEERTAVTRAAQEAAATLAALPVELLAARAADVRDVGARIVRILAGESLVLPEVPSVAVADDLPPSVAAELPPGLLLGIALEGGSATSHAVILARGLGIPAVVRARGLIVDGGLVDAAAPDAPVTSAAPDAPATSAAPAAPAAGTTPAPRIAVDGQTGQVVLDPDDQTIREFQARAEALATRRASAARLRNQPAATADGERVALLANIGAPEQATRALEAGAEGVGLFRTEFLFMKRPVAPSEDEQVGAYQRVFESFGPDRPVVVRLADIGGDKALPYLGLPAEANPFLGVRAIRLAYRDPGLLGAQLRAIWRAAGKAGVTPHVMAPMVATLADVELLMTLRDEARRAVVEAGGRVPDRMVTGIMVEIPSAALLAPQLARRLDFFSIGTNDLTQYTLAADRSNPALAELQDGLHPAVLRLVAETVRGADAAGIPVAVCGELAGDPVGALALVALGVDELSADAGSLDEVRVALAGVTRAQLDELAAGILEAGDAATVRLLAGALAGTPLAGTPLAGARPRT